MIVDTGLLRIWEAMRAAWNGAPLTMTLNIGLYVLPAGPGTHATVWADIQECAFGGYAIQTCGVWGAPFLNVDFSASMIEQAHTFSATMAPNGNIYGWFLVDVVDNTLMALTMFPAAPIFTAFPLFTITVIPALRDLRVP